MGDGGSRENRGQGRKGANVADIGDQPAAEEDAEYLADEVCRHHHADDDGWKIGHAHAQRQQRPQHAMAKEDERHAQQQRRNGKDDLTHGKVSAALAFGQNSVEGFQLRLHPAVHCIGPVRAPGVGYAGRHPGEQFDRLIHRADAP